MSNVAIPAEVIRHALAHCTGTERWFRHPLNQKCLCTEGAMMFADMASAYWLLDIFATELIPLQKQQPFMSVSLRVDNDRAAITAEDGNGSEFRARAIDFTDCPPGEWKFFITDNVILLPSEY